MSYSILRNLRYKERTLIQSKVFLKLFSTTTDELVLPKRIKRGPTDILRTLANITPKDHTAPHYKYHDDPYLIPYSNLSKRTYALAQEAGRKAAQWVRQEHQDLFQHKVAEPPIEAFMPKPILDENSEVTEHDLKKAIDNFWVSDAILIYNLLKKNGADISQDDKKRLLELVSYYNCEDSLQEDWIEERWFRKDKRKESPKNIWKNNSIAEELFSELKPDQQSYSAIITGMCQHGELSKAWKLYEESIEKKISLNINAFNALISRVNFIKEAHEMMWKLVMEFLTAINQQNLRPNIGTLNAVLESLSFMATNRNAKEYALSTLAEFKMLGIEPSLASYYHLLNIFYRDKSDKSGILIDIIDHIKDEEFTVLDTKDSLFFTRAMEVCRNHHRDKELAYRINAILHLKDNYNFIGDSFRESNYYRYFFTLLCDTEPFDVFMKFYDKLVPNIYIPEPSVMLDILNSAENLTEWNFLPKLWSDMKLFDHNDREKLLEKVLQCASKCLDESLLTQMNNIGWEVWNKIEGQKKERGAVIWTGKMLSDSLMIFINTNDLKKACFILNKLIKGQNEIVGEPDVLSLQLFVDLCIENNAIDFAIKCVEYSNNVGFFETGDMAKKLLPMTTSLSEKHLEFLETIVGKEVVKKLQKTSH